VQNPTIGQTRAWQLRCWIADSNDRCADPSVWASVASADPRCAQALAKHLLETARFNSDKTSSLEPEFRTAVFIPPTEIVGYHLPVKPLETGTGKADDRTYLGESGNQHVARLSVADHCAVCAQKLKRKREEPSTETQPDTSEPTPKINPFTQIPQGRFPVPSRQVSAGSSWT
jgi:hypothetical protein